jgi:hypothetical protein
MKYLKTKNISKFSISDKTFIANPYGRITTNSKNSLQIPAGSTAQRPQPSLATNGMMRLNTTTGRFEMYQANDWRDVKFKSPSQVTYQSYGPGNNIEILFGILNPAPPATIEDGLPWTGAQLMVYAENVFQLFGTNFSVVQNPCNVTGTIISFTSGTKTITSSNTSIINFLTQGFHTGQTIVITGSGSNDGIYTVATVTSSTIVINETLADEAAGASVTIVGRSTLTNLPYPAGYYIKFNSPVPSTGGGGNPIYVTVITGFDS